MAGVAQPPRPGKALGLTATGIYRAVVTRVVAGGGTHLTIPQGPEPDREYGPVEGLTGIDAGSRVLVAFIANNPDDVVILREL